MDSANLLIKISMNYPAIALLIKYAAIIVGLATLVYTLWIIVEVNLLGTMQPNQAGTLKISALFFLGGCMVSLGWTLNMVGNSFYNYDDFILQQYADTDNWLVSSGETSVKALQTFVIASSKIIGLLFGFWGMLGMILSAFPGSETKWWPGFVRLFVGASLFNPVAVLDFFGGFGTRFLVS